MIIELKSSLKSRRLAPLNPAPRIRRSPRTASTSTGAHGSGERAPPGGGRPDEQQAEQSVKNECERTLGDRPDNALEGAGEVLGRLRPRMAVRNRHEQVDEHPQEELHEQ